ncbi:MAG: TonB-dependent receptor [Cytophagales bacterium]|nr:MAG: TonB-dependent receptor [Cytophagales bacterium]
MNPILRNVALLLCLSISTQIHAQMGSLSGTIQASDQKPVEGAVVSLVRAADSVFVKAALTEANGSFALATLKLGDYRLIISCVGYQNYVSQAVRVEGQQTLPTITLLLADKTLKEVNVVAKKPFVEQRIDRVVVNPDALISNAGATSLEMLEKAPGIQIDPNGIISLKGRAGVVVFIDDKPSYLSATDLANYLRSLPAGSVETIEIMTNPPAKYDAAGNAGVINIRLKKNRVKGFNGGVNLSYGQGRYARSNNSANLNYRINKLNVFSNVSLNTNNSYQDLTIKRNYFTPAGVPLSGFSQNSYLKRGQNSANLKLGVDYYASKKTTLGVVLTGLFIPSSTDITNRARLLDAGGNTSVFNEGESFARKYWRNGSVNLNYAYRIDSTGKELSANVDYITYSSDLTQSLSNFTYSPSRVLQGQSLLDSDLPSTLDIRTAKLDYVHPVRAGGKWESGLKRSDIRTGNVADFFDVVDGKRIDNYQFTNDFTYREAINAAYLNYSREGKRLSVQTGLRFENTAIWGYQLGNRVVRDSSFTRAYNSLFPTAYVTYKIDSAGKHRLGFSYGRRINRPNYQDMNPFTYPLDRFSLYGGNPFLRPTFSDNIELSHTFNNAITTTLQFSRSRDVITETIEQGTNVFYSRPGNLGRQESAGISVNGTRSLTKWWTLQLYTELTYNRFRSSLYNQQLDNAGTFWYIGPTNLFQFGPRWSVELAGNYQTRVYYGQFVLIPVGSVRVAASRKIWKDKGTLKVNISDVFYTQQPGGDIRSLANSTASWLSYLDSRVVTASLSYRFSKGQNRQLRQTGGADSEQRRVKS